MKKSEMKVYETDASRFKGKALNVVHPETIAEVRRIIAGAKRIVPRGGGTGLVGGCVPQNGLDVVLDLSKLDKIGSFDKERRAIEVGAGVILEDLEDYLFKYSLEFPVKPLSHEICTIGGMIATDAGGTRTIKYGKTSSWIRWVEVIDDHGNLYRKGATELSDYSGMEGITGVIVRACLKLEPRKRRTATLISFDSYEEIISIVRELKRDVSVSMIEFLGKRISEKIGFGKSYHLIVEYENDSGKLSGGEYENLLASVEKIPGVMVEGGYIYSEDPKVLLDRSGKLIGWLEEKGVPVFGHIGVGVFHPGFSEEQKKYLPEMMKLVKRIGGQISGEYGIGILKKELVEVNDKKILINVKKRTDPENKFNVGKMI